jgi:hypothetical protein
MAYAEIAARDPDDPSGERRITLRIDAGCMDRLYKGEQRHLTKWWGLFTACQVLQQPERIFRGIVREGEATMRKGLCYVGRPLTFHDQHGRQYPRPARFVYTVYVSERLEIYDWRPEQVSEDDPSAPEGWHTRYMTLAWTASR